MSTAPDGLVSLAWPTRGGYGYRLETSPNLAHDSWQPLATFHGTGGTLSIPVARITLPGAQPPPPAPPVDVRSAHFVLRTFTGLNKTLVAWNQPGQTGLSQVLLPGSDFSSIVNLPLFFGTFEDPANATDYLLSFLILGGEFDPSYDLLTPALLNPEEAERLAWFTDRLAEVKAAMEFAQANGQATNNAPATGAGSGGPGVHVFFRIAELYQDSDGDGILDHHEGDATGSDPWDSDSDNDGFSDGEEFAAGSDPHDPNSTPATATGAPPGSDLPPEEDEDDDTIPNALDADPLDQYVDWERRPFPQFLALPIPNSSDLVPAAVNNKGQVVLNGPGENGNSIAYHWKPGMAGPVALKLGPATNQPLTIAPRQFSGYDTVGKPVSPVVTLTLAGVAARDINDLGVIVGEGAFFGEGEGTTPMTGTGALNAAVTVALQWDSAGAAPRLVHPGFADMTQPGHNWGDLLLDSAATKLNESGMITGQAEYRIGAPGQAPPFLASAPVPNYWSPFAIGGEGASLYNPAEIPIPAPTITGLHRVNDEFTGGAGGSNAAYWNVWTETPAHVFPEAGAASVGVATVPNGREAIAGDRRLMLESKEGRWEPALRTYGNAIALTEDGTVWVNDSGQPQLWHPLEEKALKYTAGGQEMGIGVARDVTNTGIAIGESGDGNVLLFPLDVRKAWSDQLQGVEVNFMPDGTGSDMYPYVLMGAAQISNFDKKGHVKVRIGIEIPEAMDGKLLFRLAKTGAATPAPAEGSSIYVRSEKQVNVVLDDPQIGDDKSYVLIAGFDDNASGELEHGEFIIPETIHHMATVPFTFNIVSHDEYAKSLNNLLTKASLVSGIVPHSSSMLNAFGTSTAPSGATETVPVSIGRNGEINGKSHALEHVVGIIFQVPSGSGNSIDAVYGPNSLLVSDFAESSSFWGWLNSRLLQNEQEVRDAFDDVPESVLVQTFRWRFSGLLSFSKLADPDLFGALGRVDVDLDVEVDVHRFQLAVVSIKVSGTVVDLYDFDHESVETWVIPIDHPARTAAEVQAGYNSLGTGGRVYRNRLEFEDSDAYSHLETTFRYDPPL